MRILPLTRYARQAMEYGNEDLHIDSCGILWPKPIVCSGKYNQIHRGGCNPVCICGDYWTRYTEEYSGVIMMKCIFVEVLFNVQLESIRYNYNVEFHLRSFKYIKASFGKGSTTVFLSGCFYSTAFLSFQTPFAG